MKKHSVKNNYEMIKYKEILSPLNAATALNSDIKSDIKSLIEQYGSDFDNEDLSLIDEPDAISSLMVPTANKINSGKITISKTS